MLSSVLSVLLMGMVPVMHESSISRISLQDLSIAAPSPMMAELSNALSERTLSASGIVIVDLETGQQLFGRGADTTRPLASLTKLMTALVIIENHALDDIVTIPNGIEAVEDAKYVKSGESYKVGDLLTALLVSSANDVAVALAVHDSGNQDLFAEKMNARARILGLKHTSFQNPVGFDHPNQWSSPQDIAWLTAFVLKNPELRSRLSRSSASIVSKQGRVVSLVQTHVLLSGDSPVIAGKTGTTDEAGQCLMSIVEEGGRTYVVVLLGSQERYADMRTVLKVLASLV